LTHFGRHPVHAPFRAALLWFALLVCAATANAAGDDSSTRLAEVRQRIAQLVRGLEAERAARDRLATRLQQAEQAVARGEREIRTLSETIGTKKRRLTALRARAAQVERALRKGLEGLAAQLRAGYAMGRQDRLQLLLNQEDPAALARVLAYHGYFVRARAHQVETLRGTLAELRKLAGDIAGATTKLAELRDGKRNAQHELELKRKDRAAVLVRIEGRIADRKRRLGRLREDEQRLTRLIATLRRELADIPVNLDRKVSFKARKGRLPWPTNGRVLQRYGTTRRGTNLKWQGILIGAKSGTPVRAVHRGRVAFADWLRGYGLMLIIDHGAGYMSLYGHNRSLYKEPGDWVEDGELVARVGDSGGKTRPALYFEIRAGGAPLDPRRWLARRVNGRARQAALVSP